MNQESTIKIAIVFFALMLFGSLGSALVGALFGALVAVISPELIESLFSPKSNITGYAAAVGMIWGVFIGAAVSGFACFLATVIKILRLRFEKKSVA